MYTNLNKEIFEMKQRSLMSVAAIAALASFSSSTPAAGAADFYSHDKIGDRHHDIGKSFGNISAQTFDGGGTSKKTDVVKSDKVIGDVSGAARTGGNIGAIESAAKSAASLNANGGGSGDGMTKGSSGGKGAGTKKPVGFAAMKPQRRREIASMGGRAAHAAGAAHQFNSVSGRSAALSKNKSAGAGAASPA